jgi:antitoxin component YwqK of YwqJK toxin-antitoxin module
MALALGLAQVASSEVPGHPDRAEHRYYTDGSLESVRYYRAGKKTGRQLTFWENGTARSVAWYADDVFQGEYRTFYASGRPYELRHFDAGRELGLQQSWSEDGSLFLNYEARGGRRYGLVNAKPCVPVAVESHP